ncbi:hypothetical protein GJ744_000289 [Endocarpon pusillum]|uniref:BTB domain transcription factor n=1 Tax=Endocarpon pusillum TaxID=364733 RepID=A0A8H7ATL6_9EURO|nr:hypothetical protein GJ744_000289 [Endocarpon pusillum]
MAGTRSSSRLAAQSSSPSSSQGKSSSPKASAGTKRKQDSDTSPAAKKGKTTGKKKQKTLEETVGSNDADQVGENEADTKNGASKPRIDNGDSNSKEDATETPTADGKDDKDVEMKDTIKRNEAEKEGSKMDVNVEALDSKPDASGEPEDGAVEPTEREDETPASILEKGIIYFFFRGRVGIDDPSSVDDIARSYMVLRPLPHGAKLGEGEIGDAGNCRLLALPKKVLPVSGKDRFMVFVEKTKMTFKDLKDSFLSASDYATKTAGTRHTPAATPVGEGIYAITTTGRESHLAYILTIPAELSEVQQDIGLRERGSFVTSTKNPKYPGPANANLPKGPDYPRDVLDEFRSLRWMPLKPKHLDYVNTQFLVIGEGQGDIDKATQPQAQDEKEGKEKPLEELENLEGEDEIRVKHLKGDDAVFADLHISSKEYPKVQTTW